MRISKFITISLPPEQLKTAERLAKKQSRTMSELFREGLRRLQQEDEWRPSRAALAQFGKLIRSIQDDARRSGLDKMTMREINTEIAPARKGIRTRKTTKRTGK